MSLSPNTDKPRIAVVGAGVVGSCIALTLRQRGAQVVLIDRSEPGAGCSHGNSGALSPSSVAPLAMPGILASVPGMLLNQESPLYLPLAHLPKAAPWLLRFVASARPTQVARSAAALAKIHADSITRHEVLAQQIGVPELLLRRGHLHVYPDANALSKDAGGWRLREQHGFKFQRLDRAGIDELEPGLGGRYQLGMFLEDHATIRNPRRYVQAMAQAFTHQGGILLRHAVKRMTQSDGGGWRLDLADAAPQNFDHVVVAAGAWSKELLKTVRLPVPLESQRGYHAQFEQAHGIVSRTVVLADRKIFVTPMEDGLRVGGTVEIAGLRRAPDMRRAALLEHIARQTFSGLEQTVATHWMGHRPCMPDSVPLIGQAPDRPGLWLAVGHGHLGLTDSVNTAFLIADALLGSSTQVGVPKEK